MLFTIIGKHQSQVIKNTTLLYTLFLVSVTIDASNKPNKDLFVNARFKLHVPISNLKLK